MELTDREKLENILIQEINDKKSALKYGVKWCLTCRKEVFKIKIQNGQV